VPLGQLLRTKLVLPPPRPGALPRTALVDRLRTAAAPGRTVLVVAGAGWGKSTLVEARQVLRGCPDPGHLCADPRTVAPEPAATPATGSAVLSPRQAEILRLLADDLTSTEIADRLALSRRTGRGPPAGALPQAGRAVPLGRHPLRGRARGRRHRDAPRETITRWHHLASRGR
jgi:Bacterial regulatory proteins, luxR family